MKKMPHTHSMIEKFAADFSVEMRRSIKAMLNDWRAQDARSPAASR